MPNVVFFEICVDDLEGAAEFYSRVFGWEISEDETDPESWNITSSDDDEYGLPGALTARVDEWSSTVNTIEVPSLGHDSSPPVEPLMISTSTSALRFESCFAFGSSKISELPPPPLLGALGFGSVRRCALKSWIL